MGPGPGQLLPPGVDCPVNGPTRCLCAAETSTCPNIIFLNARDGTAPHGRNKVPMHLVYLLVEDEHFVFLQVIFKLNYIPHETLRVVLGVLKQSWSGTLAAGLTGTEFGVAALKCFHRSAVLVCNISSAGHALESVLLSGHL